MRSWLGLTSLAIVTAALPSVARADVMADSITLTLKTPKSLDVAATEEFENFTKPTDDVKPREFNYARCVCDEGPATLNVMFDVAWANGMKPTGAAGTQLFAWAGSNCSTAMDRATRETTCTALPGIADAVTIPQQIYVPVGDLLTPGTNNPTCKETLEAVTYGLYTSMDGQSTLTKIIEEPVTIDMKAPPVPTTLTVQGQEGQIELGWDAPTSEASDIAYYQALCALVDGSPAHDEATNEARYDTAYTICGIEPTMTERIPAATIENAAQLMGTPVAYDDLGELALLSDRFICGQVAGNTAEKITLGGLQNGAEYMVVLLSVDKAGNSRGVYVPMTVSPQPVDDFWEDLNEENPDIEGGLCLVESTYGAGGGGINGALRAWRDELRQTAVGRWFVERYYAWGAPLAAAARANVVARIVLAVAMAPLVAVALVWNAIGLPAMLAIALALVWLRRRRKLVVAAVVALVPSVAAAQSMTPYWDDELAAESAEEATGPKWHFGIRIGPYLPGIDDDRFMSPGPYEQMFGEGSWMPALDLHRLIGTRFGQLGGGLSVGYFQKTADAYIPNSGQMRAEGNENTLKIVPFEATAIWRASQLHDNWGIPLVPYLRGGLGYYLWWVRRPDGEFAKACPANMTNCDRAIGGSLGLVGAAGLAIRAENIDPSAARSMRDSGLDHAGFYAEFEMAWVDGFGSAKKMSLGDTTWSAGIDFEF